MHFFLEGKNFRVWVVHKQLKQKPLVFMVFRRPVTDIRWKEGQDFKKCLYLQMRHFGKLEVAMEVQNVLNVRTDMISLLTMH